MGEEAKFLLVESIKASGVELKLMEPLILHKGPIKEEGTEKIFDNDA
jgi:tRNA1(Val) A37 N6-methylase TrmN6